MNTACWLWSGKVTNKGYGWYWDSTRGRLVEGHRLAWEMVNGPVPDGLELDHLCRVRSCANPSHLEPVTHRENLRRGDSPVGRAARSTHCKSGHPLTVGNNGKRLCRPCRLDYWKTYNRFRPAKVKRGR